MSDPQKITSLLADWRNGNRSALDALMPLVYEELHRRAQNVMRAESAGHTLQPTALIHEAYLRLAHQEHADCKDRMHFFAVASQIIRHILVDHARARRRLKRGGPAVRVELTDDMAFSTPAGVDVVMLDEALDRLTQLDSKLGRLVELRFYGGLSNEETAEAMGVSPATVKREWAVARA